MADKADTQTIIANISETLEQIKQLIKVNRKTGFVVAGEEFEYTKSIKDRLVQSYDNKLDQLIEHVKQLKAVK